MIDIIPIVLDQPQILGPLLGAIVGGLAVAIGRFIWKNHGRSTDNSTRIDRQGRTLYGDDANDAYDGLTVKVDELSTQIDDLETRITRVERKIDRICNTLDA